MKSPDGDCVDRRWSRRAFLRKMGAAAGAMALSSRGVLVGAADAAGKADAAGERKNVLFLVVDDLNTWLLGDTNRYAGKVVAPNIRRLADSGVLFDRAYTASPVCCPSRTAMLSGVCPWKSGLYHNGLDASKSPALKKATFLPELFRKVGYYIASYGKVSHGWRLSDIWDDRISHKRDPVPPGAPLTAVGRGEQDWGVTHVAEGEMHDTTCADAAIRQLQKKHDRPFFVACGLFHPHMPWYVPKKYFDMFPLDEVTTPEFRKDDLDDVPPLGQELNAKKRKFVEQVLAKGLHKDAVRAYLATTAYADAQMGRVLDALDRSQYRENTIVVLISDHGFHLGEKMHWQKATLWEEATHCLMMARVPGMTRAGGKCERFVSLQDIYPTLVELCGLQLPPAVDGRSLAPLLKDPKAEWKSTAVTALADRYITIRTDRFRYTRYRDGQEELYDCSRDPREWTNEIGNPQHAAALKELRASVPALSEMSPQLPSGREQE